MEAISGVQAVFEKWQELLRDIQIKVLNPSEPKIM
jgi:hypothetical protein